MKIFGKLNKIELRALQEFVGNSVVPLIYEESGVAMALGTGSLHKRNGRYYLVTAAHVLKNRDPSNFGIPVKPKGRSRIRTFLNFDIYKPNDENYDVAIIELSNQLFIDEVIANWNVLSDENVGSLEVSEETEFLLAGFPTENVEHSSEELTARTLYQFYTGKYSKDFPENTDQYDFFMQHQVKVIDAENRQINMVNLEGISGSPVWILKESGNTIWSPTYNLQLVGVQFAYLKNSYIRAKSWNLVEDIFRKIER